MALTPPRFRHEVIDADPPGSEHDITLTADLTGNGLPDIIIGGKKGDPSLFWYENPGWTLHAMSATPELEAGGVVVDINGDGRPDVVAGEQWGGKRLFWFECPEDPRQPWTRRIIEDRFEKYHDQVVGDADGDGEPEILISSQNAGVLAYYDIPDGPEAEPWPRPCCHVVATDFNDVEGLAIVDIDGDGVNEIIAGPSIFRPGDGGEWRRETLLEGWPMTRVVVADVNGDGHLDLVLAEGESEPGRLAWLEGPDWTLHLLADDLFHPHSLAVADLNGDGTLDIFTAEMGLGNNEEPRMLVYAGDGRGGFEAFEIGRGIPTHEAKLADLSGDGRMDIVGKPYHPERHIDVWWNET
ncbi:MAG: VCBS repeat-containing protein [Armatimonadia bacterium]|nr:VCBS repeat-containing protein [Armatimonadia bacterium]